MSWSVCSLWVGDGERSGSETTQDIIKAGGVHVLLYTD
jgi:hypothetical protein